MKSLTRVLLAATAVHAATLGDVCTSMYIKSVLPDSQIIESLIIDPSSITASAVYNASIPNDPFYPAATISFCNVTLAYAHPGKNDRVLLNFWLPTPEDFKYRWFSTGGGGLAINSGDNYLPGGLMYGGVTGRTDGGFGSFDTKLSGVLVQGDGSLNYDALYMFGYKGIHELTIIGKAMTKTFYGMVQDNDTQKLYAYYQGCSEGGREGFSQVQRYAKDWDGAMIAAPAIRFSQQQVNHLVAGVIEQTMGYVPPPCELEKIVSLTISACDKLDGRADGVVARTDLCQLHFDVESTVGARYSCPATRSTDGSVVPAQSGKVSRKGAAVALEIMRGLHTTDGRLAYMPYQHSATFDDAQATYNATTGKWEAPVISYGGEYVARFLQNRDLDTLPSLKGVTYDTLVEWMQEGWQRYEGSLQTTWPDLTPFQAAGGKILHIHGEVDPSIPAGTSTHYHEAVRRIMYPDMSFEKSTAALNEWNRLFLIPGGAHCGPSTSQPNGGWPQTTIQTMIDWVEKGEKPEQLKTTVLSGENKGEEYELCAWPLRPLWKKGQLNCVFDQESYETWVYQFDAFKLPVY
ncbi:tannase [Aspergillus germanicus]